MADLHYLPAQEVERSFPERLTIRGTDVDALCDLLKLIVDNVPVTDRQFDLIDRVMKATGRWGHDEWAEPLDED